MNTEDRQAQLINSALDTGAIKQAQSLCAKALRKKPDSHIFQSLNALILLESGKYTEASAAVDTLISLAPTDPKAINTIRDILLALHQPQKLSLVYEGAVKKKPNDEQIARTWFFSMVANGDERGQQRASLGLSRGFGKTEYFYWYVASLARLAEKTKGEAESALHAILAYRAIEKVALDTTSDKCIKSSEEMHLYMQILLGQKQQAKALEVLEGEFGQKFMGDVDLFRMRLDLLASEGHWDRLRELCEKIARDGRDDWKVYKDWLNAVVHTPGSDATPPSDLVTSTSVSLFYLADKSPYSRNANLALVKFAFDLHEVLESDGTWSRMDAMKTYFQRFCNKTCCYEDLQAYLEQLPEAKQKEFLMFANGEVDVMAKGTEKEQVNRLAAFINARKFEYLLEVSQTEDVDGLKAYVAKCVEVYAESLALGTALLPTDNQYGDDLVLLTVHALLRLSSLNKDTHQHLFQSVILLEYALSQSKNNHQLKLLLTRISLLLASFPRAISIYESLSVKQVQNDTLSHTLLTRIATLYPTRECVKILRGAMDIYTANANETPNMMCHAYEKGAYSQIAGFSEFYERLDKSLWRGMVDVEGRRVARMLNVNDEEVVVFKPDEVDRLRDNRDYRVMLNCNPSSAPPVEEGWRLGAKPGHAWMKVEVVGQHVMQLIEDVNFTGFGVIVEPLKEAVESEAFVGEATRWEVRCAQLLVLIGEAVAAIVEKKGEAQAKVDLISEWLTTNVVTKLFGEDVREELPWLMVHKINLALESCKQIAVFQYSLVTPAKSLKLTTFPKLKSQAKTAAERLTAYINEYKKIIASVSIDKAVTGVKEMPGREYLGLRVDEFYIEQVLDRMRDEQRSVFAGVPAIVRGL
ncbi:mitochondrial distribution and morphology [Saitoella coloradoensis]